MVIQFVKNIFSFFGIEIRKSESFGYNKLARYEVPASEWSYQNNKIHLLKLNIAVNSINSPLVTGYRMAKALADHGGVFSCDQNGRIRLTIEQVNFFINYGDELYVIHEVFVSNDYNLRTRKESVLIDVGLNIGATSLFFAGQENIKRVYAYELFEPTYRAALQNLALNEKLSHKIVSSNIGLGRSTQKMMIPYSESSKARMGFNGLPVAEVFPDAVTLEVSIADVADEIMKISQLEPNVSKICKMDCEGAEFEILARLFESNCIRLIDVYIIEWHYQSTSEIEAQFLQHDFSVIKSSPPDAPTGLLYAFRNNV